jgi:hypothetical protein
MQKYDKELEVTPPIDAPQEKQTKLTLQYYCDEKREYVYQIPTQKHFFSVFWACIQTIVSKLHIQPWDIHLIKCGRLSYI